MNAHASTPTSPALGARTSLADLILPAAPATPEAAPGISWPAGNGNVAHKIH